MSVWCLDIAFEADSEAEALVRLREWLEEMLDDNPLRPQSFGNWHEEES